MLSGTTTASHHPMQTILSIPAHHNINNNNNNSGNNNNSIMNNEIKTNMDAMSTNINNGLSNQNNITFAENILSTLQQHQLQQLQQQQQQQQQQQLTAATDATQKGVAINHAGNFKVFIFQSFIACFPRLPISSYDKNMATTIVLKHRSQPHNNIFKILSTQQLQNIIHKTKTTTS